VGGEFEITPGFFRDPEFGNKAAAPDPGAKTHRYPLSGSREGLATIIQQAIQQWQSNANGSALQGAS
jgi:hypothetical protein